MTFTERYYRSPRTYLGEILDRLQRAYCANGHSPSLFQEVCDMASIPRDLRRGLLLALLETGYATDEGAGWVRLTTIGSEVATTPPDHDEPIAAEDRRLYRLVPTSNAPRLIPGARPGGLRHR